MSQPMPLYRQIAVDLRRQIEDGKLPPTAPLPSEGDLREKYGHNGKEVSRNTIRAAIELLVSFGLVETRPGQGTFVLGKVVPFVTKLNVDPETLGEDEIFKSEAERQGREPEATPPKVEVQPAGDLVARQLERSEGAQVISRHQERRIDGKPWSMQTTFYPMDLVQENPAAVRLLDPENIDGGVVLYLKENLGISQVGWRDTIIARPPTANERTFFDLSDKVQVAMVEFRRTGYDKDGKPIRFTVTVYPADRNQFELEVGPVPRAPLPASVEDGGP
jgi:GntR family transcriptional regulator